MNFTDYNLEEKLNKDYIQKIDYKRDFPGDYKRNLPIVEIGEFPDAIVLPDSVMPSGVRGYWIVGKDKVCISASDPDPWRVYRHETAHKRLSYHFPNHSEGHAREIENQYCGRE